MSSVEHLEGALRDGLLPSWSSVFGLAVFLGPLECQTPEPFLIREPILK
jgi:hypothetical protein